MCQTAGREMDAKETAALRDCHFVTAKPVMFVANVDEDGLTDNRR